MTAGIVSGIISLITIALQFIMKYAKDKEAARIEYWKMFAKLKKNMSQDMQSDIERQEREIDEKLKKLKESK